MQVLDGLASLRAWVTAQPAAGFVPTMGALHHGHLSLVRAAQAACPRVVVSIFVNPLQFGVGEDFSRYPRPLAEDTALLEAAGVDALFLPAPAMLYPEGFQTTVKAGAMADVLCGAHRPGHFDGVLTVVLKLLQLVQPAQAFFGEKDYQQLSLIRRMVADFHLPVPIIGVPTVREPDGLALSSRNRYLSPAERILAPQLYLGLCAVRDGLKNGLDTALLSEQRQRWLAAGFTSVDYLELRDAATLQPATTPDNARLFVAARLGTTRLIDNLEI